MNVKEMLNVLNEIYGLCEDCQGRRDGFNCPVQGFLDKIIVDIEVSKEGNE